MTDIKKKLQDEISVLEYEYLVELPKEILKARAHGDLSENAEYHAAKDRQGFLNARIGQLKKRLAEMSMVDFSKIPHNKVGLGSTVVVLDIKEVGDEVKVVSPGGTKELEIRKLTTIHEIV